MKHISKKIAAIEEPLEISHYVHDEFENKDNSYTEEENKISAAFKPSRASRARLEPK